MRVFIAIDLEESLRNRAAEIETRFRAFDCNVKFTKPENLHFTLKFLGEVPDHQVKEVEEKVSDAVKDVKEFNLSIEGVGFFGNRGHISVLWAGVKEGRKEVVNLIEKLNQNLNYIRRENHKPSPHLTIGRVKTGRNREALLETINSMRDVKLGEMPVKSVKLKQSVLTPEGPQYSDLKVCQLSPNSNG